MSADSILETARHNFARTAERLGLSGSVRDRMMQPKESIRFQLNPVLPSSGQTRPTVACIVRHSDALGPAKGGIRMTTDVTADDITGLAMEMTWKTALIGVPFGGGKSGIVCDPRSLTPDDREVLIRSFTRAAHRHIGPEIYVPAPDMGTSEQDMGYIRDCISYSEGTSITRGCFVTGKPVILGGIYGRREATGKGVVYTLVAACRQLGLPIEGLRVAVQGFGNVGAVAAEQLSAQGARIVAVTDLGGGVRDEHGLDVAALRKHAGQTGSVQGFAAAPLAPEALFELPCDLLIPAAAGSQITSQNAGAVRARIIAEGANAPVTPEADAMLHAAGVVIIPDILCNAGGVFVSYLEYTQETQREQMTLEAVESRLQARMEQRFADVYECARIEHLPLRDAAMNLAVGRVAEGLQARGAYP